MEVLSHLFHNEEDSNLVDSYTIGGVQSINHLLFADDLLFFSRDNWKSLSSIKKMLDDFASFSGLETNPDKSSIYFLKIVR